MKQIVTITLSILLTSMLSAKNKTMEIAQSAIKETVKLKDVRNGTVYTQELYILKDSNETQAGVIVTDPNQTLTYYAFANGNKFNSKSEIMIKFNSDSNINIEDIESKYNLKLKRKMNSGDYLFENLGANTLDTINLLLKDESSNIKRISPNMIFNMKPM